MVFSITAQSTAIHDLLIEQDKIDPLFFIHELVLHIFGFLLPQDLGRICCTCRVWNCLGSDSSL
jgi:hypothetical protein